MNTAELAATIDHTILKAEAMPADVDQIVAEAMEHGFASVCVNGIFAAGVVHQLADKAKNPKGVKACAVAGFPLGAMKPTMQAIEATGLAKDGVDEIDFVAHLPHLIDKDLPMAKAEYTELVKAARSVNPKIIIKVIVESAALMNGVSEAEAEARIALACQAVRESGCDFIKTSTGFHPAGGASVQAVTLMKKHGQGIKVKASGGIRSYDDAMKMLDAGADRLGCSAGIAIVSGAKAASDGY